MPTTCRLTCCGSASAPATPDGAHVEFARQIRNPVAVKIGPDATAQDVLELIEALDPGPASPAGSP